MLLKLPNYKLIIFKWHRRLSLNDECRNLMLKIVKKFKEFLVSFIILKQIHKNFSHRRHCCNIKVVLQAEMREKIKLK